MFREVDTMLSKLKRPVLFLLIALISVQIFQILYREYVLEISQNLTDDQDGISKDTGNEKLKNGVNKILENNKQYEKGINKGRNKNKKALTTSEISTTTEIITTTTTKAPAEEVRVKAVTNDVQAKLAEKIRGWSLSGRRENVDRNNTVYHGRDLLKDPVFKFNPHFKNPCWFEGDELRCLPYLYVIGVKKCGTSDLFYRIGLHPDFVKPGFKEAQFFARKRFRPGGLFDNINEYAEMFHYAAETILDNANKSSDGQLANYRHVTGEGSPSNLHLNTHWKFLPGNENLDQPKYVILDYIHHFIPQAKMIITFRDPVERLYSDYYHEYGSLMKTNKPNPRQFHRVVTEGVKLYKDCFKRRSVRSCVYEPSLYEQTKIQIQLGIYYIFWMDLTRLFPRNQILVLQNKNLRDKETTMRKVYRFLELRPLPKTEMETVVTAEERYQRSSRNSGKGPMLNETLEFLQEFYRPFNRKMARLTNDDTFLYEGE
ncbi:carbohydrate sulfotransferase 15-like isoform X2 [Ruditapes philippinarum]|uniref:carbohydrate sulfotransferase 15-like isoform X2 n=1 Tax=Ruditapes philippinarum TaxID=129788 RepID=UPI00295B0644|nr:carbohydrate sulfotransferase 15-like isoform X2 [Ruditapes philippinarum]